MKINKEVYDCIVSKLGEVEKTLNKGGGNPYHDELGRFAEGPAKAFGEYDTEPTESMVKYYGDDNGEISSRLEDTDVKATLRCIATGSSLENQMNELVNKTLGGDNELAGFFAYANNVPRDVMSAAKIDFGETGNDRRELRQRYNMWSNRAAGNIARALAQAPKVEKLVDSYERRAKQQGATEVLNIINKFKSGIKATKALMNTSKYLLEKSDKSKSMHNVIVNGRKENAIERVDTLIAKMDKIINGGKGSGNFGHAGRPGKVGGSGKGNIVSASKSEGLEYIKGEQSGLISSPDSSLGVTPHDFEEARDKAIKRGGDIEVKETDHKTYTAGNKFYDREFQSKKEAESFRDGYTYAKDATAFTQVDYIRTEDGQGSLRWDVMWKGTDVGVGEKASFKNPLEAQRWTEGYNAFVRAMESEVPSDKWLKKE